MLSLLPHKYQLTIKESQDKNLSLVFASQFENHMNFLQQSFTRSTYKAADYL